MAFGRRLRFYKPMAACVEGPLPKRTCLTKWAYMETAFQGNSAEEKGQSRTVTTGGSEHHAIRVPLPRKVMIGMLVLLIGAVAVCGIIFISITKGMLHEGKRTELHAITSIIAAGISQDEPEHREKVLRSLAGFGVKDIDFMAFTDSSWNLHAIYEAHSGYWKQYKQNIRYVPDFDIYHILNRVRTIQLDNHDSYVMTVPVFSPSNGNSRELIGYLHISMDIRIVASQIRYLQGYVLITCMGVVLLALPLAYMTARHVTDPIEELVRMAHALAAGHSDYRANVYRSDELGELADTFNHMADEIVRQQEDIKAANTQLEQKVQQRTAELEKVNTRLKAEMAEKEDFLRAVSHDLNAPLRNISGMASMLMIKYQATLEKDAVQRLERIQKNVEIECELINEILELSRIKTRREKLEPVDLQQLVKQVADQFENDLETRGITLNINSPLPVMTAERSRMRQVFQNLIDNAIKYMRQEGPKTIDIDASGTDDELIFTVRDTGMGIATEDLPFMFHVFRRAKNAQNARIPGKGVGLASVKSIIENYNGRLWVESKQGEGTTFFIALPTHHFVQATEEVQA